MYFISEPKNEALQGPTWLPGNKAFDELNITEYFSVTLRSQSIFLIGLEAIFTL